MTAPRTIRSLVLQLLPIVLLVAITFTATLNFSTIRQFFISALGENADIRIDAAASSGTLARPWRNLAQGGESNDWSLAPLTGKIALLHTEYIRVDHLYDFYVNVGKENGRLTYDYTKLDALIRDMQKAGAKPFLSLSYMPSVIAQNGDITSPPNNWSDWQQVIANTIQHVSGTLGVANVYYEVWNEPDLFGKFTMGGSRNYLTLYQYAAQGAIQARNNGTQPFKFGGPATTGLYKNWADGLGKLVVTENLPFDFFSWHRYSPDIEVFRSDVATVRGWLSVYPQLNTVEMQITEWGFDPQNNSGYDTTYGAIHTIAMSTEFPGLLDRAFVFEVQDGKDPEGKTRWGRWGIMDAAGQVKPRYEALRFLEKLGSDRIQLLGRGTWVKGIATKDGADTSVILVNYDPSGRHFEFTPVTFANIVPGTYTLEKQQFMGTPITENVATTSSQLQVTIPMQPNTAIYLKLHQESTIQLPASP